MTLGTITVLLLAGFLMLLFEVFIPGGILGAIGSVLVVVAIVGGFLNSPELGIGLLVGSAVLGTLGFIMWIKWFPRSPVGRRLILQDDGHDWRGFGDEKAALVGKTGVAHTTLRPAGTAIVDGQRVDVVTRGEMVEAKAPIKVIQVEGNRVVVTATEAVESQA